MKYSIIIPVYNAERRISNCVKSLQEQTFSEFEAVIIDDGSSDRTAQIIRTLTAEDRRFRYYRQENAGPSAARNRGIAAAAGEYIFFLDSDDQYEPDYLEIMDSVISQYPDYDHYWCGYKEITRSEEEKGQKVWNNASGEISIADRTNLMDGMLRLLCAPLWNKAFRREIIRTFDLKMDETLSLGEDLLFNYEYLDAGRAEIVMIDRPMYQYTVNDDGSLNTKYRGDLKEILDKLDSATFSCLQKWGVSDRQFEMYYRGRFWHYEQVFRNAYRDENPQSAKEKSAYVKRLMSDEDFRHSLKYVQKDLHPLYRFAYQSGNWNLVRILDRVSQVKQKIRRKS